MKKTLLLKLIATNKFNMKDGLIDIQDQYFNLLPAIFVSSLIEYFYNRNELHHLYLISWFWGYGMSQKVAKEFGLEKPEKIYSFGMDFIKNQGLGLYCTDDYYPGEFTHFKIETNPYLRHLDLTEFEEPIDYFIAGLMGGGGCIVHDAVTQSVELNCKAEGKEACEFITGTEKELKNRNVWKIAKDRYKLSSILEFQRSVHENFEMDHSEKYMSELSELLAKI